MFFGIRESLKFNLVVPSQPFLPFEKNKEIKVKFLFSELCFYIRMISVITTFKTVFKIFIATL